MTPTEHGEIWWARLRKRRPVVIVGRDDTRGRRRRATVAQVTTTIRGIPTEVALDVDDGLPRACVASCDELATLDKTRLVERIGRLSDVRLDELDDALAFALQLERR